jgi:hypothetical protein
MEVVNIDTNKHIDVNTHKGGNIVACRCCTSLAEGTAGIEFAGGVERPSTARDRMQYMCHVIIKCKA